MSCPAPTPSPSSVIPANAGTHFDFRFTARSNINSEIQMDPSVRWDDGAGVIGGRRSP